MDILRADPLALLSHGPRDTVVWRRGDALDRDSLVAEIRRAAGTLPQRRFAVNLCRDRYVFLLGFAAAMLRGQTTLLAPSRAVKAVEEVARDYPDCYCLTDRPVEDLPLEQHVIAPAQDGPRVATTVPEIPADLVAAIAFTSGSTGRPAPHPKRWGDLVCGARLAARRFEISAEKRSTIVATIPPQHMYGLEVSILLPLVAGVAVHGGLPFFPEDLRRALAAVGVPRVLFTTPTHLKACVEAGIAWPDVDFVVSATAPMSLELAERAEASFGAPLREIYGCTEVGSMASRRTREGDLWRLYEGMSVHERGGRVYIAGPQLPEPVPVNDVVECHGSRIKLIGRPTDLVSVAGNRASLADLTLKLNAIEGVRDGVFVMPEPNDGYVTRLAALVVAPGLDKKTILAALAERMNPVFLPRPLHMVDWLPRSPTGKLPRAEVLKLLDELSRRS